MALPSLTRGQEQHRIKGQRVVVRGDTGQQPNEAGCRIRKWPRKKPIMTDMRQSVDHFIDNANRSIDKGMTG